MTHKLTTAAIIGTNWGQIHLQPLREAGLTVNAYVGQDEMATQAAAAQAGVPVGTNDIMKIGTPDVVVIASPASAHIETIQALPYSHLFCEKPVIGWQGDASRLPPWSSRLLVNYAFSQLETAKTIEKLMTRVHSVTLKSTMNLGERNFCVEQWFFEVASHPLSWLLHWLGEPEVIHRQVNASDIQLTLRCQTSEIDVLFSVGGEPGIFHELQFENEDGHFETQGCYRPGFPWRFEPIYHNGQPVTKGEYNDDDVWLQANKRSLNLALSVFRGDMTLSQAEQLGAFGLVKALWIEKVLQG